MHRWTRQARSTLPRLRVALCSPSWLGRRSAERKPTMAHIAIMARPATRSRFKRLVTAHPLMSYFVIAFIGTWAFWLPVALSRVEHGLGLLPFAFSDGAMLLCLVLGGFAGPPVAALTLTAMSSGRAGVGQLLRRCVVARGHSLVPDHRVFLF